MAHQGQVPDGAVKAGEDGDDDVYVARVDWNGEILGGKVHSGTCYIAHDGREIPVQDKEFDVLCVSDKAQVEWVDGSNGKDLENIVKFSSSGAMVVGRMEVRRNTMVPGWVQEETIHAPYDCKENTSATYELLKITGKIEPLFSWQIMSHQGQLPEGAVLAGRDDGYDVYVASVEWEGKIVGGKVHNGKCYIPYDGREIAVCDRNFFVLCFSKAKAKVIWVDASNGQEVENSIEVAPEGIGSGTLVGKMNVNDIGTVAPGWIRDGLIHVPYGCKEITSSTYQLLTISEM